MDSWLNALPSHEREKIRKRLRSPEVYAESREKVQGPEELKQDLERNAVMAELKFALETEPKLQEALKSKLQEDIKDHGFDSVLVGIGDKSFLEDGDYEVQMISDVDDGDVLAVLPQGNPKEAIPIKLKFSDQYVAQFSAGV